MTDIYCGIGKVPTGLRRGTMKECATKGQIRYYGVKKIDGRLLEWIQTFDKRKATRSDILVEF